MGRDAELNRARMRDYYHLQKEDQSYRLRCKEKARQIYIKNRDAILARSKKYREAHREKYLEASRRHYYLTAECARAIYTRRKAAAKKKRIPWLISLSSFVTWWNAQPKQCRYCRLPFKVLCHSSDGMISNRQPTIDRMDNARGYELDNITLACGRCNFTKSNYFTADEMSGIGVLIRAKELSRTSWEVIERAFLEGNFPAPRRSRGVEAGWWSG
jgi:hypothetical protein